MIKNSNQKINQLLDKFTSYDIDQVFYIYLVFVFINTLLEGVSLSLYKINDSNISDYLFAYLFLLVPIHMFIIYCLKFQAIDKLRWYFALSAPIIFGSLIIDDFMKPNLSPSTYELYPSLLTFYDSYIGLPLLIVLSIWIMLISKRKGLNYFY
ncbi:7tmA_D3_dopamine_R domain containing protein [Candidatus Methylopumilus planktonicus]